MKKIFVKTENVKKFISLVQSLKDKPDNLSKMALVYGEPGLGKSRTALWMAAQNDAIYIRCNNMMSSRWFLEELAEELGEIPRYYTADLFKQCINKLIGRPQMLIIDEIDYLASDQKAIETIRDIHDRTNIPIIFVGMTLAEKKLSRYRHLYDRVSEIVHFQSFTKSDVREIITQLSEVEVTDCAIEIIYSSSNRFRQMVRLISKIESMAKMNNFEIVDEKILQEVIKDGTRKNSEDNQRVKHILSR
jgi:DNA transposition AAA+ family ATPase